MVAVLAAKLVGKMADTKAGPKAASMVVQKAAKMVDLTAA